MKNGQFPAIINLGDLNGKNGFKLNGEVADDFCGHAVSAAGDINSDGIADLLVSADGHASNTGRSYVVFGGPSVGNSGVLALSNLNGQNGFKLDGEATDDWSGVSVSAAGDINNDKIDDLLVGADSHDNNAGRSYAVFGGPTVGGSGVLKLSSLNGKNGFKLDGEVVSDHSGYSVSAAEDINDDGVADLLVGAYAHSGGGRSYVVFGGTTVGGSGVLALANLNGKNGFKLNGEAADDWSGNSVSGLGDVNGDGVADLLIGAPNHASNTGRSYVVFGGPTVGSSGIVALSSLNSNSGFKLDGEAVHDHSGWSVSGAGDFNGDGVADLLVGAYGHASGAGRSYVVLGGPTVGNSGELALSSLNGENGFKLDGEAASDGSGYSVSAAGDINGDGVADLVVGAPYHANNKGRSYVVFGGPSAGGSGVLPLSSLNGMNGFKLDGEAADDESGCSVSGAGDINNDGVDDLVVGAHYHGNDEAGRSYVVFGDAPPVLINNSLSLSSGETVILKPSYLGAYDRNHNNNTLVFIPSNVTHGYFSTLSAPTKSVVNFTQSQIINGEIQFAHDGTTLAPSYNITVRSSGIAWTGPVPANVTLSNFILENNQLLINQGQAVKLTSDNMKATYENKVEGDLSFLISALVHGQFEWINAPNQPILVFQQQNITGGLVRFIHDNSINAPAYQLAVSNGLITSPPQAALIDFDTIPVLLTNQLIINQGQSVHITPNILSATHPGKNDDHDLRFDLTALQHGQWSWISAPLNPITSFYQQNISDGLVQFTHDNSILAPAYTVSVTDDRTRSQPQAAQIDFDAIPVLLNNTLRINQNETVIVTNQILTPLIPQEKIAFYCLI